MDNEYIYISCPHCSLTIMVYNKELNCKIFRHGIYKKTGKQIHPHLNKKGCDLLKKKDLIYGCGKPFKVVIKDGKFLTESCGYI